MRELSFAFIREGSSDDGLLPHLRSLMIRAGAVEVLGTPRRFPGSTKERLEQVLAEDVALDLIFVHRDSDGRSPSARQDEVRSAASALNCPVRVISVVPIQELESWLITDEGPIRHVMGKPRGRTALGLPPASRIEVTADPKSVLLNACMAASESTGRRREKHKRDFSRNRQMLLERLDIDGPVRSLPSWMTLERDISVAVAELIR